MNRTPSAVPLYRVIFSGLCEKIVDGTLMPGALLPSENELCSQYNTTRETVRRGLKLLEQEGLIYSLPRRGYFVNSPRHNEFVMQLPAPLDQGTNRFQSIDIVTPEEDVCQALEISPRQKVIAIARGSYYENQQFGVEQKYFPYSRGVPSIEEEINYAVFPDAADAKMSSFSYYTRLRIRAVTATGDIRRQLGCGEHEALLLICRTNITQDGLHISYSRQYLRAPYAELSGSSGYIQKQ